MLYMPLQELHLWFIFWGIYFLGLKSVVNLWKRVFSYTEEGSWVNFRELLTWLYFDRVRKEGYLTWEVAAWPCKADHGLVCHPTVPADISTPSGPSVCLLAVGKVSASVATLAMSLSQDQVPSDRYQASWLNWAILELFYCPARCSEAYTFTWIISLSQDQLPADRYQISWLNCTILEWLYCPARCSEAYTFTRTIYIAEILQAYGPSTIISYKPIN